VIDPEIIARLEARGIPFCLMGAGALAVRGFSRLSDDLDLLTLRDEVLDPAFWSGVGSPEIRRGAFDDPLRGLERWSTYEPPLDLAVGRGHAARFAVETAETMPGLPCRVATPLALVLLKLEAGGAQDRYDIIGLVERRRAFDGAPWLSEVDAHLDRLSSDARACWRELEPQLQRK
jgi:hypothetical protein